MQVIGEQRDEKQGSNCVQLLKNLARFRTGKCSIKVTKPSKHWSKLQSRTPGNDAASRRVTGSFQLEANQGCSKITRRPACTCNWTSLHLSLEDSHSKVPKLQGLIVTTLILLLITAATVGVLHL